MIAGCSRALLHNIRFDEGVAAFSNASGAGTADEAFLPGQARSSAGGGACTAISFRTGEAPFFRRTFARHLSHACELACTI